MPTPTNTFTPTALPTPTPFAYFYLVGPLTPAPNNATPIPLLVVRVPGGDGQTVIVEECVDASEPCAFYDAATTLTTYTSDGVSGLAFHLVDPGYTIRVTWNGIVKTVRFAPNVFYRYVDFN